MEFDASQIALAVIVLVVAVLLFILLARHREYRKVRFGVFLERERFNDDEDDE